MPGVTLRASRYTLFLVFCLGSRPLKVLCFVGLRFSAPMADAINRAGQNWGTIFEPLDTIDRG